MKKVMHGGSRPPRITFLHFPSQIERIDGELALLTLFAVNSNHLLVPPSLLCIRHHKKLTTGRSLLAGLSSSLLISRKRPALETPRGRACWRLAPGHCLRRQPREQKSLRPSINLIVTLRSLPGCRLYYFFRQYEVTSHLQQRGFTRILE